MRALNQIRERFTTFAGTLRWDLRSASMFAVAALVLAVAAALQVNHGPPTELETIFAGRALAQSELDEIEAALGATELNGYRIVEGQLRVPLGQRSQYLVALKEAGCLPESFHETKATAVLGGSPWESHRQQLQRVQHLKEREAELLLIRAIEGVSDAYVRFDETAGSGLRAEKTTTALVSVTTQPNRGLDARSVRLIQEMLLGMKAGLSEEDITVQDLTAGQSFRGGRSNASPALAQHSLEHEWTRKLSTVLSFIPAAEIVVRVETDGTNLDDAKAVRVSVGVPTDYVRQLKRTQARDNRRSLDELEAVIRTKIQAAILPLLPTAPDDANRAVAVNFFDVPATTAVANSSGQPLLVIVIVIGLATLVGVIVLVRFTKTPASRQPPDLKVYAAAEEEQQPSTVLEEEQDQLQAKLRAYVDEDPDAAAKSLAEFIDRAS